MIDDDVMLAGNYTKMHVTKNFMFKMVLRITRDSVGQEAVVGLIT